MSTVKELGRNILFFIADNAKLLGFTFFFLRTTQLQRSLLILIECLNIFYWKSVKNRKVGGCGHNDKICTKLGPMLWKELKKLGLSIWFFSLFS